MKKIEKLCGTKKTIIILNSEEETKQQENITFFCKKCQRESKDKIFLCYPEIKK